MVMLIITISVGCLLAFMSQYTSPCLCIFFPNFILCVMKSDWEIKNVMKQTFFIFSVAQYKGEFIWIYTDKILCFYQFRFKMTQVNLSSQKVSKKKEFYRKWNNTAMHLLLLHFYYIKHKIGIVGPFSIFFSCTKQNNCYQNLRVIWMNVIRTYYTYAILY